MTTDKFEVFNALPHSRKAKAYFRMPEEDRRHVRRKAIDGFFGADVTDAELTFCAEKKSLWS